MTREEAKELLPIIQAFAEDKPIQDKIEGVTDWVDTDEINFEYEKYFNTKKLCSLVELVNYLNIAKLSGTYSETRMVRL